MKYYDKLIFELSVPGRCGFSLPADSFEGTPGCDYSYELLPSFLLRGKDAELPQVSEPDVVRHYTNLSDMNFGVDTGLYPLGSCTMKYNPKINEELSALKGFTDVHPLQPLNTVRGCMQVYNELSDALCSITGMSAFTLNPFAGAHGELTGLMLIKHYHELRGDSARTKIIVPDSAHGTNPASAAVCGFEVVQVKSRGDGRVDVEDLKPLLDNSIAGMMMTNPNTLGLFESSIREIAGLVHECGGLLYYDGANLNPLVGVVRPGDMGFDVLHLNLHKSFSTPHGGGGPGSGPVGVSEKLLGCLPEPAFYCGEQEHSMGRISGFQGNFTVIVKALAYILSLGRENVRNLGPYATLSANYIKESLKDCYELPVDSVCKHEFVFDGLKDKSSGVTTLDVAKRLLDYGYHAPTIYFPLLFHQSLMIEPTETESKQTIDEFIEVMRRIAEEASSDPALLTTAPHATAVRRLDETTAARHPVLKLEVSE